MRKSGTSYQVKALSTIRAFAAEETVGAQVAGQKKEYSCQGNSGLLGKAPNNGIKNILRAVLASYGGGKR